MIVCGSPLLPFDVNKITWIDGESARGKFQFSEDFSNPDHKALLKFLVELAGGCVVSEGLFYWVYPKGDRIGRKVRAK